MLDLIKNQDFQPSIRQDEFKIHHCAQIGLALKNRAHKLANARGMEMHNTQFSKKEDRL